MILDEGFVLHSIVDDELMVTLFKNVHFFNEERKSKDLYVSHLVEIRHFAALFPT